MISVENKATQMDDLLDKMAEAVQLDITRHERMISSYESVKDWIENDETFFSPYNYDVYPHGSVRILTTVKPFEKAEFDLDIAVHLKSDTPHTPQKVYNELKRCMDEYAKRRGLKIEAKNRCIRLNYAGDYHMDILPGIQEGIFNQNKLKVPDRKLGNWVSSNPRGYADWFMDRVNLVKESLLEKSIRAEKLPVDNFKKKKPLQRAVQLIKRYRDIYFQKDDTYKTSSIILTTIAGQFYQGEDSIFNTVDNIVATIHDEVRKPVSRLKILNPVNYEEDFTDKWDSEPEYYEAFKKFAHHLYSEWQKLKVQHGVLNEGTILKGLFGDDIFAKAQNSQSLLIEELRKNGSLGVTRSTGIIAAISSVDTAVVKSNTFFGGNEK
jgi:hypothetical protein